MVCSSCHRTTDGLRPGLYVEDSGQRLDPVMGVVNVVEADIERWKKEREGRIDRRRVQRAFVAIRRMALYFEEVSKVADTALSRAYAGYFDCLDAVETLAEEIDLLEESLRSARSDNVERGVSVDMRAIDRAEARTVDELETIFVALTELSESLDKVQGRDALESVLNRQSE